MIEQRMASYLATTYRFHYPFVGAKLRQLKNGRYGVTVWDAQRECHLFILCSAQGDVDIAITRAQKHVDRELNIHPEKYPMGYQAAVCLLQSHATQARLRLPNDVRLFVVDVATSAPTPDFTGTSVVA